MKKPILIASASFDEHAYGPVAEILNKHNYPVIVYKTDQLLSTDDRYSLTISNDAELTIKYNDQSIMPEDLTSAWFRKIANFSIQDRDTQLAKQLYMNNEVRALHDTIWNLYPEDIWLSSPQKMAAADRKLGQLLIAREIGFNIPRTIVGSDWDYISKELLPSEKARMTIKMMRGVISDGNDIKALYATIVNREKLASIVHHTSPFPGLYQPYITKAREWRITVVGDEVFPVAIYTDNTAKDDWRKHQESGSVTFKSEKSPVGIDKMCVEYLGRMGLGYGAFDLIEQPDGCVMFLECNPNGQYGWLEQQLELPISEALAKELISVGAR